MVTFPPDHVTPADCGRSGSPSHWHRAGCYEMINIWFLERLHVLGIAALVLAFIQVSSEQIRTLPA